jgi:dTDP-4-dehydrorhamnose 3,5-epimerase
VIPNKSRIADVVYRRLDAFQDSRGSFRETFRQTWFPDARFVQGNASVSQANVLRGMHYHLAQADYWVLLSGRATAALAELRGAARGRVEVVELTPGDSLYIPTGVAHGFYAHEDALLSYLVTNYYDGSDEHGIAWNDPTLAIPWPCRDPILSPRDRENPLLSAIPSTLLPNG